MNTTNEEMHNTHNVITLLLLYFLIYNPTSKEKDQSKNMNHKVIDDEGNQAYKCQYCLKV